MKRYFLTRTVREQVLVLAFVLLAAVAWLTGGVGRARDRWLEYRSLRAGE